ncbi:MAG: hypothetical protein GY932_15420 [Arcobacter sp.]|nr:hypothetical protein [Arcobacter sp.]
MKNKNNNLYFIIAGVIIIILFLVLIIWFLYPEEKSEEDDENETDTPNRPTVPVGVDGEKFNLIQDDRKIKRIEFLPNDNITINPNGTCLALTKGIKIKIMNIETNFTTTQIGQEIDLSNVFDEQNEDAILQSIQISDDCSNILAKSKLDFFVYSYNGSNWVRQVVDQLDFRVSGDIALSQNQKLYCSINNGFGNPDPDLIPCRQINCRYFGNNEEDSIEFRNLIPFCEEPNIIEESPTHIALSLDNTKLAYTSDRIEQVYIFTVDPLDSNKWSNNILKIRLQNEDGPVFGASPNGLKFSPDGLYLGVIWPDSVDVYDVSIEGKALRIFNRTDVGLGLKNIFMSNNIIVFTNDEGTTYKQDFIPVENKYNYTVSSGNAETVISSNDSIVLRGIGNNIELLSK